MRERSIRRAGAQRGDGRCKSPVRPGEGGSRAPPPNGSKGRRDFPLQKTEASPPPGKFRWYRGHWIALSLVRLRAFFSGEDRVVEFEIQSNHTVEENTGKPVEWVNGIPEAESRGVTG